MKKHLLLVLLLGWIVRAPAQTNVIFFPLGDVGVFPEAGLQVQVKLNSPFPRVFNGVGIVPNFKPTLTDTNGIAWFTNLVAGNYYGQIDGAPGMLDGFTVATNTTGMVNGWSLMGITNIPNPVTSFYTAQQVDTKLAAIVISGGGTPLAGGNGVTITTAGITNVVSVSTSYDPLGLAYAVGANVTNDIAATAATTLASAQTFTTAATNHLGSAAFYPTNTFDLAGSATAAQSASDPAGTAASALVTATNTDLGALAAQNTAQNTALANGTNSVKVYAAAQASAAQAAATLASTNFSVNARPTYTVYCLCPSNNIVPDNQVSFTNLQIAINLLCSNYQGGTITMGSGEFYSPGGYLFPSNQYFNIRITGQGGSASRITCDTNLFYLAAISTNGNGLSDHITIDHVGCFYKGTNCAFLFYLDFDWENIVRDCWIGAYANLTNNGAEEWFWGDNLTVPQGVAVGWLGGDNANAFQNNVVCGVAAGLILGADHYRCDHNQWSEVGEYGAAVVSNNWNVASAVNLSVEGGERNINIQAIAVSGACYILQDYGDTDIGLDHIFNSAAGFYLTASAKSEYGHRVIHNNLIESVDYPILVESAGQGAAPYTMITEYSDNMYYGDYQFSSATASPFFTMDATTYTITQTNTSSMDAVLGTDVQFSGGFLHGGAQWAMRVGGLPILTANAAASRQLALTNTYSFWSSSVVATNPGTGNYIAATNGNLTASGTITATTLAGALPATSLTGTVPMSNLSPVIITNTVYTNVGPSIVVNNVAFLYTNPFYGSGGVASTNVTVLAGNTINATNNLILGANVLSTNGAGGINVTNAGLPSQGFSTTASNLVVQTNLVVNGGTISSPDYSFTLSCSGGGAALNLVGGNGTITMSCPHGVFINGSYASMWVGDLVAAIQAMNPIWAPSIVLTNSSIMPSNTFNLAVITNGTPNFGWAWGMSNTCPIAVFCSNAATYIYYTTPKTTTP